MDEDELHELTAAYALDALDADEAAAYERHLAGCESCRDELARLAPAAAALAYAVPLEAPRPELRARILETAAAERPNVVPLPRHGSFFGSRAAVAVAAVAACVAVGLGAWDVSLHHRLDQDEQAIQSVPLVGATGSVVIAPTGRAALVVASLPAAPAGKTYEAWVIRNGAAAPAGLFEGGARTTVVKLTERVPSGSTVAVTVEPAAGSAQPTSHPFITSQTV